MLGLGAQKVFGAASSGECVEAVCCQLPGPSDVSEQHLLVFVFPYFFTVSMCVLCLTKGNFFIFLLVSKGILGGNGGFWRSPFSFLGSRGIDSRPSSQV